MNCNWCPNCDDDPPAPYSETFNYDVEPDPIDPIDPNQISLF